MQNLSPEQLRRTLLWSVGGAVAATIAWLLGMFFTCQPALDFLCICAFAPIVLAAVWVGLGLQLLTFVSRYPQRRRFLFWSLIVAAFLLPPYILMRAGGDMFTLSFRYHLWRAGGVAKVRAEFSQWLASRPSMSSQDDEKMMFHDVTPGRGTVLVPVGKLPASVRYLHDHFPSRFGISRNGVARLDNVTVFTTTYIMIGPPGWEPQGGASVWDHIVGRRHKVADGIWIDIGTYDK